jgi:hypothetical protein
MNKEWSPLRIRLSNKSLNNVKTMAVANQMLEQLSRNGSIGSDGRDSVRVMNVVLVAIVIIVVVVVIVVIVLVVGVVVVIVIVAEAKTKENSSASRLITIRTAY